MYDQRLAERVRGMLAPHGVVEKKMMGGLCFMVRGHMCCGVLKDELIVRVGRERHEAALAEAHAGPMTFTGRTSRGFVVVAPAGLRTSRALERWVSRGIEFVDSLPPKANK
jgi:TfoX/Sxy family transcriptional regulator of competence genes